MVWGIFNIYRTSIVILKVSIEIKHSGTQQSIFCRQNINYNQKWNIFKLFLPIYFL